MNFSGLMNALSVHPRSGIAGDLVEAYQFNGKIDNRNR